ncbi:endonuclease/exonuclease/phosphatase family protein [Streptomyces sp. RFCAC02]|uniref:endonuclease/exonuclease/phosphatase family protein n=1 Tax=Streptomyces sp. RFCAC02 TaxID=2499143 RepID=UPI0010217402|nr:endonuclease/exonuclease/phosphatase family protein [Streptomyces sp. RFCAC02]
MGSGTGLPAGRWRWRVRLAGTVVCAVLLAGAWALMVVRLTGADSDTCLAVAVAGLPWAAAAGAVPLVAAPLLRAWRTTWVAVALVAVEIVVLAPRFTDDGVSVPADAPRLRVATSSAHAGAIDPAALVRLVREERVDVLAVAELSAATARELDRAGLAEVMPYRELRPEADSSIYSRLPLRDGGLLDLDTAWPQTAATAQANGRPVRLIAVHTYYPLGDPRRWADDMTALREEVERGSEDTVLLGDFNAGLDHAAMRDLLAAGVTDTHDELGEGWAPTWPAGGLLPPLVQLDHVLHGPGLAAVSVSEHTLPGTDHRSVVAELALVD